MRKVLVLCLVLAGCATTGQVSNSSMLAESIGVALLAYETSDISDEKERAYHAIEQADKYLQFVFQQDATLKELVYGQAFSDPRSRRLVAIAKLVLNENGTLTGTSWADALLDFDSSFAE